MTGNMTAQTVRAGLPGSTQNLVLPTACLWPSWQIPPSSCWKWDPLLQAPALGRYRVEATHQPKPGSKDTLPPVVPTGKATLHGELLASFLPSVQNSAWHTIVLGMNQPKSKQIPRYQHI